MSASLLADDLGAVLAAEPPGLSGCELARRVQRRKADVLAVLRTDPRFEHHGRTNGSRWQLRRHTGRNGNRLGTDALPWEELDPSGVPFAGREAESA